MIPYMVGKPAPNSSYLTSGLVKYVPVRGYFRAIPSQNGDKFVTSPFPPPNRCERVNNSSVDRRKRRRPEPHLGGRPEKKYLAGRL